MTPKNWYPDPITKKQLFWLAVGLIITVAACALEYFL